MANHINKVVLSAKGTSRVVRPIVSTTSKEARASVLAVYKELLVNLLPFKSV